ncbi:MAG: large repetitive protein, partial [Bradyrhizobium sp.]|nr:large repetitive protein [Bradyrhizobium sp.]
MSFGATIIAAVLGDLSTPEDTDGAANAITEGAAVNTTVGVAASSTANGNPVTYSLVGDSSGGGFKIDPNTGVVTVADPSRIDFESAPGHAYTITTQASNGFSSPTTPTFTISVTDIAPSTPADSNAAANAVLEGATTGTTVGVTASSTDVNGGAVTYSLVGDTSGGGFTINAATGVVTVADSSKIDFESSAGHAYTVTVQSSDGTLTSSQSFNIAVTDVAPSAPTDANGAANTVAEGAAAGTAVAITASSTDVNGPAVTWSLTGDSSGSGFSINSSTGVITVADPSEIDYETAAGHAYSVTATASDGTLTSSQSFSIAVTDVVPSAPTDNDAAANSVAEGAANGTSVGVTASSTDPNGPAAAYSLTDNAGGTFAIDSATGVVTVANGVAIDFEGVSGHAYNITVQALVGAISTSQTFSIGITDVAPSTPADTNAAADTVLEGAANGTAVGITATSADPGGGPAAVFSLTDNAGARFAIDSSTGMVSVANGAAIDFETASGHAYNITVQALAGALTSTRSFSIGVGNVNEAPAGTDKTVTTAEDTHYVFAVADFGFTDPSDSSAPNALQAVKITTLPGAGGTLTNHGNPVSAGDFIPVADITGGFLQFIPAANANGSPEASFTFQVQDNGGTANGGVDTDPSANTLTINVTPVNDPPSFTAGANQTVAEDAGAQTVTGFVGTFSPGPADEAGQTVDFITSNDNNALFLVQPGIDASGNLTYTPAANANGSATVTVQIHDNGGGADTSVAQSFAINVNPVNDTPSFTVGADQTVAEDAGPQTVAGFIGTFSPGPADEAGQTVNFITDNNNHALFLVQPTIDASGNLTYTTAADANGSATVTVQIHDNGGGADTSVAQSFAINVNPVN